MDMFFPSSDFHMPSYCHVIPFYPIRGLVRVFFFPSSIRFESVSRTCRKKASSGDVRGILANEVQWNCMCILSSSYFIGNMSHKQIYYSDKYNDEHYEYRHVVLPREMVKQVPKSHLMSEDEWRRMGVQQSLGWVHYMIHEPEPHILLFRRPLPKN
ncbi:uncharacterized protein LOC121573423 [Coregonus clupeaformis]|uniref:uncharacterized protein LOC121573423 n=1 Tax=Coregonus clupeaformis TaxID=59861 RepID=UPI001E1C40C2|nr:uncharacterized protein LOC121573423 [Coregonus clupeaformis]